RRRRGVWTGRGRRGQRRRRGGRGAAGRGGGGGRPDRGGRRGRADPPRGHVGDRMEGNVGGGNRPGGRDRGVARRPARRRCRVGEGIAIPHLEGRRFAQGAASRSAWTCGRRTFPERYIDGFPRADVRCGRMSAIGSVIVAVCVAFVFSLLLTPLAIKALTRLKAGQPIRDINPSGHAVKRGTPTMGGLVFMSGTLVAYIAGHLMLK